jgi:signal transduction histidine kinase
LRVTLAAKVTIVLLVAVGLAITTSVVGFVAARHAVQTMEAVIEKNVGHMRAVSALQVALLEQRGFVSSYVLDGDRKWLEELAAKEPAFRDQLEQIQSLARTAPEKEAAEKMRMVFDEHDALLDRALALCDEGRREEAWAVVSPEIKRSWDGFSGLCDDIVRIDYAAADSAVADWRGSTRRASVIVTGCAVLAAALSVGLLLFLVRGVLGPLNKMAAEARAYAAGKGGAGSGAAPGSALRAVGSLVSTLKSDVAEARSNLEHSRERLAGAEKLASVGKLAASVAHEIRNPLTSIKVRLHGIRKGLADDPRYATDLDIVSEEIERLDGIIRSFLDFARPPELELRSCSIGTVVDRSLELMRYRIEQQGVTVDRSGDDGLPQVTADPQQLKQVFINLLKNSLEAVGAVTTIGITLSLERQPDGRGAVVARYRDDGPGIPEEMRGFIFEPFFSSKPEGTGLGLSIADRILASHGGSIELESTSERGTVFAVRIPAAES